MRPISLRGLAPLLLALGACALTEPVEPGPGTVHRDARKRHAQDAEHGVIDAARRAGKVADARPDDLRMQRKAVALGHLALRHHPEPDLVLAWAGGAVDRLLADCTTRREASEFLLRGGDDAGAADGFARAARQCGDRDAALSAVTPLKRLKRCDEAVTLLREAWPGSPSESQIPLLDGINRCSTDLNFADNVAFVPTAVLEGYFILLERREQQRREDERRWAQEEAAQQARDAAVRRQWACESDCASAGSQCRSGCGGDTACSSRCDAFASACNAGCH
ncbi:MAG: hypothetical protein AAF721_23560 [Myxococcota bacterium]